MSKSLTRQQAYAAPVLLPEQLNMFQAAGDIVNRTLDRCINEIVVGAKIVDICIASDLCLETELSQVYKSVTEKGICFPTCISINNCVGSYSPSINSTLALNAGDIAKIELGVQIGGFTAVVGHTVVVNPDPSRPLIGPAADAICAAYHASELAFKMIRPGVMSGAVSESINQVFESFGVNPVRGVISSNMKQYVIDGDRVILNKLSAQTGAENFEFQLNEIICVDIAVSTGVGEPRETEVVPSLYKRDVNRHWGLKLPGARALYSEINKKYPVMPFAIRPYEQDTRMRMGLKEIVNNNLFLPYPVYFERPDAQVARFKFTLLLLPSGPVRLTGTSHMSFVQSDKHVPDELLKELESQTEAKSRAIKVLKKETFAR